MMERCAFCAERLSAAVLPEEQTERKEWRSLSCATLSEIY